MKYLQDKRCKKPTPGRRRGLSDEEILQLAKENKAKRGVKSEWIKEMAEWLKIQKNINKLYDAGMNSLSWRISHLNIEALSVLEKALN